ncbi:hypothetical protein F5B22DRAFT_231704 [Xylaria bambusicola]|uniref:uncharacterized protein n=1 Tax=Xylaria bambusicola TaxID=326684 RepID=UPI0020086EBA|nr:uncharacterized protein F5B22DRAFT_231704 [Xylaria bambusicola]KAI0514544.1 hypothetical protein F5B22DRAFT_231704 [Xylaria bambusicola]
MAPQRSSGKQRPAAGDTESPTQPTQSLSQSPNDTDAAKQALNLRLRLDLPPISDVHHAFKDMLSKQKSTIEAVANSGGFELRVGTICSGTEAPIFALKLIKDISKLLNHGCDFIEFSHLFSVENEPFKQAYISRNAPGSIVFRDVVDFADRDATAAPTILGDHCDIPRDIDLLVAGTSCVDFSSLNSQKTNNVKLMSRGTTLFKEWKASDQNEANKKAKSAPPLREDFFDEFRDWLDGITPTQIQAAKCGESSLTFLSTLCYIKNHRPKLIILENVCNAPWDAVCGLYLPGVGYAATHVSVDTKDYYIPQTRNRGYVVAVDRQVFGDSANHIIKEWETQLVGLKRASSTPLQHWLLSPNDPLTLRARQDESEKTIANSLRPRQESDWGRSKKRHRRVRRLLGLGKGRPMTAWGLAGCESPYDRLDKLFIKSQNSRALDCVDIYYLQCLHGKFDISANDARIPSYHNLLGQNVATQWDIRFKSQIFDLSQNVDRGQIGRNFGITGCLTPRGINLITDQGRILSGFEALNLQGLPLRDLDLTRESQDELRDLAGNAMSTTVVGAALFSLLLAIHRHCSDIEPPPLKIITTVNQSISPYQPLYRPSFVASEPGWDSAPGSFCSVQTILNIFRRCRRYCYCNGGAKYSTNELVRCKICDFIRCTSCAGNPKHQFGPPWSMEAPIMNDTAPPEFMQHFPTALTSIISDTIVRIPSRPYSEVPELQSRFLDSLRSAIFYYTRALISETVTICYSAKDGECNFDLRAVISDTAITWYLFLDPWSTCGQLVCKALGMPPAHMLRPFGRVRVCPSAKEFIPAQNAWEFWVFGEVSLDVELTNNNGSIHIANVSCANLPAAIRDDVQSIIGIYDHYPDCDAAENSLHVGRQRPRLYLFKDPTKTGAPEEDCYIISDQCRLLEKHEFRDFRLRFLPNWTPQTNFSRTKLLIDGYWEGVVTTPTQVEAIFETPLVRFMKEVGSRAVPSGSELQLNDAHHKIRTLASVCIHSNMVDETYMTLSKYEGMDPDSWAIVSRSDYSALFDLLAPININLSGIEFSVHQMTIERCRRCCPVLPKIHWMERAGAETKTTARSVREPYSISSDIHAYEKELRGSGEPLRIAINIKDSNDKNGWKDVSANYEVNVDLLRHRAADHLLRLNCPDEALEVKTTVTVKRGSLNIPNLRFTSFKNSLQRLSGNGIVKSHAVFIDGYNLTEQQNISLEWMLRKELNPPIFTEREIEECRFDALSLRVLAVAERDISRPGGILADDVGYGKTVISLALMQVQQDFDRERYLLERQENSRDTSALAASLVLAPKHLVDQWAAEAAKFLGWREPDVLVIKSSRKLRDVLKKAEPDAMTAPPQAKKARTARTSTTIFDKLHAARLIIVSTAVFDDLYYTWLGKYAGSLAHPKAIPRTSAMKDTANPNVLGAFQDWYEDATMYARRHLSGFNPSIFNRDRLEMIEQRHRNLQDTWRDVVADYYDASTRLGCQTTRNDATGELVNGKEEGTTVDREYNNEARANPLTEEDFMADQFVHPLEVFSFSRIIYDEFSYENFCVAQFVKNARAHAKWVLSATPPTSNVKAVCDIGQLLGIHVARPVKLRPGLPLITEGPALLRQNPTEKQLSYGKLYTDESVCDRVETAHNFLRHFASANPFDEKGMGKIEVHERVICSNMTRFELAKYLDLQRDLRNSELDFSKLLKRCQLDSETINEFPEEGGSRAGIALAWLASIDCADDEGGDVVSFRLSRDRSLREAQERLKFVTNVAVWLALRRFQELEIANVQEETIKPNETATQYIQELTWHIEAILDSSTDDFNGADGLNAVADSIDAEQFADCSQWFASADPGTRASEPYYKGLFTRLSKQIPAGVWVAYFELSSATLASLERSEILVLIGELGGQDVDSLSLAEARRYLEELIKEKQMSTISQAPQPENSRKKTSKTASTKNDNRPKYPLFQSLKKTRGGSYTETESEFTDIMMKMDEAKAEVMATAKRVTTALNLFCQGDERKCDACGLHCSDLRFLPDCGHLICSKHIEAGVCGQIISDKYPSGSNCSSIIRNRSIPVQQIDRCELNTSLAGLKADQGNKVLRVSPKSLKIANTIGEILRRGNDKILVFYQFDEQKAQISRLLQHDKTLSQALAKNLGDERVRMLKLNSEEAAGSNFQDANHVMFANTPVFGKQEDYDKYVKQAKGRAIRHGQRKVVYVYYFVTANTFEADLLQLRKGSSIRVGRGDVAYFVDDQHHDDSIGDMEIGETDASC